MKRKGSCLCGAVKISTRVEHTDLGACHCAKCRKWAGGPLFEVECGGDVVFEGEENIQHYASSRNDLTRNITGEYIYEQFPETREDG